MTTLAIALTVVSALGWAGFDATRKGLSQHIPAVPLVVALMIGKLPFFAAWMATEAQTAGLDWTGHYYLPAVGSVLLNVAANLLFVMAVRISPLSVTIPMLSLSPAFAAFAEWAMYGGAPSAVQAAGMGVVILGALLLHAGGEGGLRAVFSALLRERGSVMMAAVALLWAVSGTFDKAATGAATAGIHGFVQCAGVALCLAVVMLFKPQEGAWRALREQRWLYLGAIALGVVALGVQLLAYQQALVGLVEAIKRAVGMVAALMIGRFAFGETIKPVQFGAVALMSAGVALIVLFG